MAHAKFVRIWGFPYVLRVVTNSLVRLKKKKKNATLLHVSFKEGAHAHLLTAITHPVLQPSVRLEKRDYSRLSFLVAQREIMSNLVYVQLPSNAI